MFLDFAASKSPGYIGAKGAIKTVAATSPERAGSPPEFEELAWVMLLMRSNPSRAISETNCSFLRPSKENRHNPGGTANELSHGLRRATVLFAQLRFRL